MQIKHVAPSALKPYPRNARTHSRRQLKQIVKSIERFGFTNPVLVDDDLTILAGHGRVEAAKLAGLQTVPIVQLKGMSSADKRAYVLADNKLALNAGWDREILAIELKELTEIGFEVELTGFSVTEIDLCLAEAAEAVPASAVGAEDEAPSLRPSLSHA